MYVTATGSTCTCNLYKEKNTTITRAQTPQAFTQTIKTNVPRPARSAMIAEGRVHTRADDTMTPGKRIGMLGRQRRIKGDI